MSDTQKELTSIWTPANIVTCVRILFIPVYMVLATLPDGTLGLSTGIFYVLAFLIYLTLSLTDKVDGYLARSRHEITDFGKFLDPIADKLLVFSALLIFIEQGTLSFWVVFIILVREFLVSALRMVVSANGVVIAADKLGKWKTATTMVSICLYLFNDVMASFSIPGAASLLLVGHVLMAAAVVLTVISGVQYFWRSRAIVFSV